MALIELPVRTRGVCCDVELAADPAEVGNTVEVLKALADPTRLSIVKTLASHGAPICICDLLALYRLSQPTISHHMAVLRNAGLVESTKRGLWVHHALRGDLPAATRRLLEAV